MSPSTDPVLLPVPLALLQRVHDRIAFYAPDLGVELSDLLDQATAPQIHRICSPCGRYLGTKPACARTANRVTHTFCPECAGQVWPVEEPEAAGAAG